MSKTPPSILHVKGLKRSFPLENGTQLEVLKGVDLDMAAGEMVGLVGPSGSGKSSLLHYVGLLEGGQSEALIIDGDAFGDADDTTRTKARLNQIGFVYQFHHLLPELTARGNVILPQRIRGVSEAEAKIRAEALLDEMGQMSGGEQQRVAIARAMANRPKLLLADEPTGNLDPATSIRVFEALKSAIRKEKVAALIATHNQDLAAHMDRVLTLKDGVLVG